MLSHCKQAAPKNDSLIMKIGQMIMMGIPGNTLDTASAFYKDIQDGKIGGITLYERHLTPDNAAENLKRLIAAYQKAAPDKLLVAITQEGGIVNRLKPKYGFPPMPSAEYIGKLNNMDSTKKYADVTASTLSQLGINVNFAPVVDIYRADNPVLGSRERTYAAEISVITKHAAQVVRSHRSFGVATALKHFPGHGSSTKDTHLEMTDITLTWKQHELQPYRNLMKAGLADAVMTAHVVHAGLDSSLLPATLSNKMITGLLRNEMKFDGVVFSDDMHMKAIAAEYNMKKAIALAINAGVDVLLFSGNSEEVRSGADLVELIRQLVEEKIVPASRINESHRRIMRSKERVK